MVGCVTLLVRLDRSHIPIKRQDSENCRLSSPFISPSSIFLSSSPLLLRLLSFPICSTTQPHNMNQSASSPHLSPPHQISPISSQTTPKKPWSCEQCAAQRTPARRRGPNGSVTLCNACGLRLQKKNKELAAAAASRLQLPPHPPSFSRKPKRSCNSKKKRKRQHMQSVSTPDLPSFHSEKHRPNSTSTSQLVVYHPSLVSYHAPHIDAFSTDILQGEQLTAHDPLASGNSLPHTDSLLSIDPMHEYSYHSLLS